MQDQIVITTRPIDDAQQDIADLKEMMITALAAPMLEIPLDLKLKVERTTLLQTGVSIWLKRLIWKKIGSRAALLPETYFFKN